MLRRLALCVLCVSVTGVQIDEGVHAVVSDALHALLQRQTNPINPAVESEASGFALFVLRHYSEPRRRRRLNPDPRLDGVIRLQALDRLTVPVDPERRRAHRAVPPR